MEIFKEKAVGFLMVTGAAVCIFFAITTFTCAGGGIFHATLTRNPQTGQITDMGDSKMVPLNLLGFVVGLCMIAVPIIYVLVKSKNRFEGAVQTVPNVRVIARYGYTKHWVMLTEEYQFEEAEDPTYYLKLETGPGVSTEYECPPEVFFSAGEGMYGEAVLKGKWCGRFAPYIGMRSETEEPVSTH